MNSPDYPTDFNRSVGQNLQVLRKAAGLSQTDLAEALSARGLPFMQQTVLKVEKGSRPLKLEEAATAADVIGVTISDLFTAPGEVSGGESLRQLLIAYNRERAAEVEVKRAEEALQEAQERLTNMRAERHAFEEASRKNG